MIQKSAPLSFIAALAVFAALLAASASPQDGHGRSDDPTTAQGAETVNVAATTGNPLKGRRWGVYKGNGDQSWAPYVRSRGTNRTLLAKIALRPKAKWFGSWIPNNAIKAKVRAYIANAAGSNRQTLVQMTVFRMVPWEHEACRRLPTAKEQASYRQWVDQFAAGIGSQHVALILQPDGPFALCVPKTSKIPSQLIAYSARKFSALPNTSVYIDGGASDWPKDDPAKAADFLVSAGVKYTRGFALNSTHYATTTREIEFGTRLVGELARRGAPGKHFVVNTSSNGQGFEFGLARGSHPDNAKTCATRTERVCVTLGIPPTADVANARWRLSAANRSRALRNVDAYLWFGRPWLNMQADPFDLRRALAVARTTPW